MGNSGRKRLMNCGTGHSDRGFSTSSGAGSRGSCCRHWGPCSLHSSSRTDLVVPTPDQRLFQPRIQGPWMLPPCWGTKGATLKLLPQKHYRFLQPSQQALPQISTLGVYFWGQAKLPLNLLWPRPRLAGHNSDPLGKQYLDILPMRDQKFSLSLPIWGWDTFTV